MMHSTFKLVFTFVLSPLIPLLIGLLLNKVYQFYETVML